MGTDMTNQNIASRFNAGTTITLDDQELAVLKLILDFHSDDEPDAHYSAEDFARLCAKVNGAAS